MDYRLIIGFWGCLLIVGCANEEAEQDNKQSATEVCQACNAKLRINGYSRSESSGKLPKLKVTAKELTMRARKGRMVNFINYDELVFNSLAIEQPLYTKLIEFDITRLMQPILPVDQPQASIPPDHLLNTAPDIASFVQQPEPMLLGNKLNRMIAYGFSINFKPPRQQAILLTADHARMLMDSLVVRFEGKVLLLARQCRLSADIALWSGKDNGLFFPESYRYNQKLYQQPAFFQITSSGKCIKSSLVQLVEYVDQLDLLEEQLFAAMPDSLKMVYGLMATVDDQSTTTRLFAKPDNAFK